MHRDVVALLPISLWCMLLCGAASQGGKSHSQPLDTWYRIYLILPMGCRRKPQGIRAEPGTFPMGFLCPTKQNEATKLNILR